MKKYFLHREGEQLGPFSLEELKDLNIQKDTPIWFEGISDWTSASEIPEIKEHLFSTVPPAFKQAPPKYQAAFSSDNSNQTSAPRKGKALLLVGVVLTLAIIAFFVYKNQSSAANERTSTEELKEDLGEKERNNPTEYLIGETSYHTNLIGEMVITGHVTNKASIATFKDIELTVSCLSKTGTEIGSKKFVVYEVIPPKQTSDFKFKTFAPEETADVKATISDAKAVQ